MAMVGWAVAAALYFIGSAMMFVFTIYDDDPLWQRVLVIIGWPIVFPYAMTFGRFHER